MMPFILCSCKSLCFPKHTSPLNHAHDFTNTLWNKPHAANPIKPPSPTPQNFFPFTNKFAILGTTHVPFCSRDVEFVGFYGNKLSKETLVDDRSQEHETETLELLNKPSLIPIKNGSSSETELHTEKASTEEEALAPFMKFLKGGDSVLEDSDERDDENEEAKEVEVDDKYYEPRPGDFVVGVVVSGNQNKINVNVGAELPGTMLTKEVLPLYGNEMEHLLCDVNKDVGNLMVQGKMGILKNDDAIDTVPVPGGTVVEIGTVLFAEVLGRTLAGRPLLSTRRLFRRIAWHRLRQGLRAFLPKAELMKRVNCSTELKENMGRHMYVQITLVDEAKNNLIISQKEAWEKLHLREGTLLEGTVKKILPYGAQIMIGKTNRSGLLHVSNITRAEITSVSDILSIDEKVKVLVVKSVTPDKISLSIADLESEPGLFLSNKERVFLEADMMAKKYREKLPPPLITQLPQPLPNNTMPFENEALYANWKWFNFEK
ncbi:uncharacterized protein LOC113867223 isoform X3 [Abrus precatorius]|uniref:Uncharacterized protein LOC113867219 isoform X3 n=1 Tax=Abrus precatorius TaxID=3816 RepID=A0A8B8LP76_ABRPR|nr:uncharacterized protein LOC113867219 isoform X3 [Abrus precatorius]XP_027358181.1 uncharacterized protein LOC113867223 isoform X3 [Abrus precatorius]